MNRTDLANESITDRISRADNSDSSGYTLNEYRLNSLPVQELILEAAGSALIGKPAGRYVTLFCDNDNEDYTGNYKEDEATAAVTSILGKLLPGSGSVLIAGLGNDKITPDSLGAKTVRKVQATAHFEELPEYRDLNMRKVWVVETGVLAQTGIESLRQIEYLSAGLKPDCIIVIDALACSEPERLTRTIQFTDTGISPGSGVGNARAEISAGKMRGTPVFAIGVPTVIDFPLNKGNGVGMVTTRDIDDATERFARIISGGINKIMNTPL
ncbi:hypothetical protein FACS189499_06590 [Clostridia bacterium]|nr:hypothetical protein FACS189499_06590 [Clostridia bacterium]